MKLIAFLIFVILYANPANAAPVGALFAAIGSAIGVSAATVALVAINLTASVVMSAIQRAKMKKNQQSDPGIKTDRKLTGGANSRSIILGYYATAGAEVCPPMSQGSSGDTPNAYLTYVINLSDFPVGGISNRLVFNGEYIGIDWGTSGEYGSPILGKYGNDGGRAWIKFYDGTQTTADPMLVSKFGSYENRPWTAQHVGRGCAYAIVTCLYDPDLFKSEPTFRFELQGAKLYDPRFDSSVGGSGPQRRNNQATWAYTDNPVVMIYNILLGIPLGDGRTYGADAEFEDLPLVNWTAAMNVCDEMVNVQGGTEKRYRAGFQIDVANDEPATAIAELQKACAADLIEIGGVYKIRAGGPGLPVMFFNDGDFLVSKEQDLDPFPSIIDSRNTLNGVFPHPEELWASHDAPVVTDPEYVARDGGEILATDIGFSAVPFPTQVQRVMFAWLKDDQRWRNHQGSLGPYAMALEPLDVFEWTSARNGYIEKEFEITNTRENLTNLCVGLGFREVDPSDYDWSPSMQLPDPVSPGGWVEPTPQAVPGFAVFAVAVKDSNGKNRKPAVRVVWNPNSAKDARGITIRWRVLGSDDIVTKSITNVALGTADIVEGILPDTDYQFSAKFDVNRRTIWSSWLPVKTGNILISPEDMDPEWLTEMEEIAASAGIKVVDELPANGDFPNQLVMLVPPGQLYRWDDDLGQWSMEVYAGIPDGAIDMTKLAQSIQPPLVWDDVTLPTARQASDVLLWNDQLWRWNGTEYTAAVPANQIDGQLIADQLADSAVTPAKLAVIPGHNLVTDPKMLIQAEWFLRNSVAAWTYSPGKWSLNLAAIVSSPNLRNRVGGVPIGAGLRYRSSFTVTNTTAAQCNVRTGFFWYDENGAYINATWGAYQVVNGSTPVVISADLNALTGAKFAAAAIQFNMSGAANDGIVEVSQPEMIHINSSDTIADSAITTAKIVNDAINAAKIANNAVEAAKIAAGAVTETKISDNAITTPKVVAGAIETSKIAAGAVAADKIAANAVEAAKIAAGAVTTAKLDALAVTTEKLAVGAVEADKIAANAITVGKIAAGAVDTDQLAANAVTAGKILAGAITTIKLDALAVTADKLAVDAVTADKIAANAITVGKIAAGAVGADQIAANAIAARHLMVADWTNLVPNSDISDAASWIIPTGWNRGLSGPSVRSQYWLYIDVATGETGNSPTVISQRFSVEVGSEYLGRFQARTNGPTQTGHVNVNVQWFDNSDTSLGFGSIHNASVTNIVTDYEATLIPPANAIRGQFRMTVNRTNSDGRIYIGSPEVRRKNGGELIVDGAITTNKLGAGSVTADTIASNAIVASKIAAGTITGVKLASSSIITETAQINDAIITNAKLVNVTITNAKIANTTITNAKIANAAITAVKIDDATITAAKIVDLTVTSIKIANNAISTYRQAFTAAASALIGNNNGAYLQTLTVTPGRTGPLSVDVQIETDLNVLIGELRLYKNGNLILSWPVLNVGEFYTNQWFDTSSTAGVQAEYRIYYHNTSGNNARIKNRLIGCLDIIK